MDLNSVKKVHFTGIGGIGVSALAKMFLMRGGVTVQGSDTGSSGIIDELKEKGAEIYSDHAKDNITNDIDLFVYTPAISEDNSELVGARELGVPVLSYPELLGVFSREYKTVAVAGTHGKTTTTGMMATVMRELGMNPTVVIGSLMQETQSNFMPGDSEYLLVEACEYKKSFLNLRPDVLIITNIEEDHLDYYEGLEDIQKAFGELVSRVPSDGCIITDAENEKIKPALSLVNAEILDYRRYVDEAKILDHMGEHNVFNASAVFVACCGRLNLSTEKVQNSLLNFKGTCRRFEYKGQFTEWDIDIYDDYAHHPTEIRATLSTLRNRYPNKKIVIIFQPHLFSRTKKFLGEYGQSFSFADEVVILPIYAARENDDGIIDSGDLARELLKNGCVVHNASSLREAARISDNITQGDNSVIMTMGAGDVFKVSDMLTTNK